MKKQKKIEECNFQIFESRINGKPKEIYETIESVSTFNHEEFSRQIKDEMNFYGLNVESLSKSCQISSFRMSALIRGNATFEQHEIDLIRKRLHF